MYNETARMSTSKLMQAVFVLHMPGTCWYFSHQD